MNQLPITLEFPEVDDWVHCTTPSGDRYKQRKNPHFKGGTITVWLDTPTSWTPICKRGNEQHECKNQDSTH